MASDYLFKPLRSLRQACRSMAAANPDVRTKDCRSCTLADLCMIGEIETVAEDPQSSTVQPSSIAA